MVPCILGDLLAESPIRTPGNGTALVRKMWLLIGARVPLVIVLSNVAVWENVVRLSWLGSGCSVNLSNVAELAERWSCLHAVANGLKLMALLVPEVLVRELPLRRLPLLSTPLFHDITRTWSIMRIYIPIGWPDAFISRGMIAVPKALIIWDLKIPVRLRGIIIAKVTWLAHRVLARLFLIADNRPRKSFNRGQLRAIRHLLYGMTPVPEVVPIVTDVFAEHV